MLNAEWALTLMEKVVGSATTVLARVGRSCYTDCKGEQLASSGPMGDKRKRTYLVRSTKLTDMVTY